ncbi:Kiwa anti-phage protein KwaB-like domain-containing protein [Sphingomonas sp. CV7422]|uniref:Kiwa anti-phage protein KwaB-like domain-containing protein n=1 Tax=Sphingomonas sp. CV7422 TaxID=3018036 RepID=UPI0022FDC9AC|nr:Kiwa anti-phage protein KwaB-like domain-containing protein [Sphingomonas sp. CV7422]
MAIPAALSGFDIENASLTIWLFKKSGGTAGAAPTYTGRWITTQPDLDAALKASLIEARARINEIHEYGLLAQNNEASALLIDTVETNAGLIVAQSSNPTVQKKVKSEKEVANTNFFVIRLVDSDRVLIAVRKTDSSWRSKQRRSFIDIGFRDNALELDREPSFSLSRHVDFFIANDKIIIPNKANFESVLSYRQAHADEFAQLQAEKEFARIFSDFGPLTAYVGDNKIHLRRMCSIRQKGHYKDQNFMTKLKRRYAAHGLNLEFDAKDRIVCTEGSCGDIITALLDHRLSSAFSTNIYDVPDATKIA